MDFFLEDSKVADYFLMAGWKNPLNAKCSDPNEQQCLSPITSIIVTHQPQLFGDYKILSHSYYNQPVNLRHFISTRPIPYIGFKCGEESLDPIVDICIVEVGKSLTDSWKVISHTPDGQDASLTGTSDNESIYISIKRGKKMTKCAIVDICLLRTDKLEKCPHTYSLINKCLQRKLFGPEVYMAFRKSGINRPLSVCDGEILFRYPANDYRRFPLPPSIPSFCLPQRAVIDVCLGKKFPLPYFFTFCLTNFEGRMVYGASLVICELLSDQQVSEEIRTKVENLRRSYEVNISLYHNKCICIISKHPFFDFFHDYLTFLYRISLSGSQLVPLERYVVYLMRSIPTPLPDQPPISVEIGYETIRLFLPSSVTALPHSSASFPLLLRLLTVEGIKKILYGVLTEKVIIVHSFTVGLISGVVETIKYMIYPLIWQGSYVPFCPLSMQEIVHMPFPCICGLDSQFFDSNTTPEGVLLVDLNNGSVELSSKHNTNSDFCIFLHDHPHFENELTHQLREIQRDVDEAVEEKKMKFNPSSNFSSLVSPIMLKLHLKVQIFFSEFIFELIKVYYDQVVRIEDVTSQTNSPPKDTIFGISLPTSIFSSNHKSSSKQGFIDIFAQTMLFSQFKSTRSESEVLSAFRKIINSCSRILKTCDKKVLAFADEEAGNKKTRSICSVSPLNQDGKSKDSDVIYNYDSFPVLNYELILREEEIIREHSSFHGNKEYYMIFLRSSKEIQHWNEKFQNSGNSKLRAQLLLIQVYASWFVSLPALFEFLCKSRHKKAYIQSQILSYSFEALIYLVGINSAFLEKEIFIRIFSRLCLEYKNKTYAQKLVLMIRGYKLNTDSKTLEMLQLIFSDFSGAIVLQSASHWRTVLAIAKSLIMLTNYRNTHTSSESNFSSVETPSVIISSHLSGYLLCGMRSFRGVTADYLMKELSKSHSHRWNAPKPGDSHYHTLAFTGNLQNGGSDLNFDNCESSSLTFLEVTMTSSQMCPACFVILYDESIMQPWNTSNVSSETVCWICSSKFSPDLKITVKIFNKRANARKPMVSTNSIMSNSSENTPSSQSSDNSTTISPSKSVTNLRGETISEFSVTYMSPWTLRHEMETTFEMNDNDGLLEASLPTKRPSFFWNLIWYIKRANLVTHLDSLLLSAYNLHETSKVKVITSWDCDPSNIHPSRPSYYLLWTPSYEISFEECDHFVRNKLHVMYQLYHAGKMQDVIKLMISLKKSSKSSNGNLKWGIYFELLWIFILYDGHNFNVETYDSMYRDAFNCLSQARISEISLSKDSVCESQYKPPPIEVLSFRNLFRPLYYPSISLLLKEGLDSSSSSASNSTSFAFT